MGFTTTGGNNAPNDAEYVVQSNDSDLTNEIVRTNAADILVEGSFSGSTSPGLTFGSWTTIDADHPAFVLITGAVQTDGSTSGEIRVRVDESGGTTADYEFPIALADEAESVGVVDRTTVCLPLPAGGQIFVENASDPNGSNSINVDRVFSIEA